jgi:hypothetical protein
MFPDFVVLDKQANERLKTLFNHDPKDGNVVKFKPASNIQT